MSAILRWNNWPAEKQKELTSLLLAYGLTVVETPASQPIPGSFWGDDEAGLVGSSLYIRPDTPIHSALHESGHFICMDSERRNGLHTDAGGSNIEECAVCYLQILMADQLNIARPQLFADMDSWGYSFRLGSAEAWFTEDADDALAWLIEKGVAKHTPPPQTSPSSAAQKTELTGERVA